MRFRLPHVNATEDVRVCDICYKSLAPRESILNVPVDRITFSSSNMSESDPADMLSQKPKRRGSSLLEAISQTSERVSMALSTVTEELGELLTTNNTTPSPHPLHSNPDSGHSSTSSNTSSSRRRFSLTPSLGLDLLSLGLLSSGRRSSSSDLSKELEAERNVLAELELERDGGNRYVDDLKDLKPVIESVAPPKPPKPPKKEDPNGEGPSIYGEEGRDDQV